MVRARSIIGLGLIASIGCTSNAGVNAAIATGALVAATVVAQAALQECYATCGPGTKCNKGSGLCVPTTNEGECADPDTCVPIPPSGSVAATNEPFAPRDALSITDDDCVGLCFENERCVMERGELGCVPR